MAKLGRKAKHFITSTDERIDGLIHQKDGRWRILATGKRFSADSPAEAIARFHQMQGRETISVPTQTRFERSNNPDSSILFLRTDSPPDEFWPWLREFLVTQLPLIAKKTGLPGLNGLDLHAIPGKAIQLKELGELYYDKSSSKQNTRGHVKSAITKLATMTAANTLAELSTPLLIKFRDEVNGDLKPTGAAALFGKIKSALAFAKKEGWDASQLDATLGRMKVLYAPKAATVSKPTPIPAENFRSLLTVADSQWRAIFIISLNLALYLEDCASLQWADIDLDAGTFIGRRGKTDIIRVGMLWPETVTALKALPRDVESPFVFVSRTGDRYRSDSLHRRYAIIRDKAGITDNFSAIRDAAYTVAARSCDDRVARMFAAHSSPGMMDHYVQRNPQVTKPASDAVHAAFSPFPATTGQPGMPAGDLQQHGQSSL